jgi:hypothetical protein
VGFPLTPLPLCTPQPEQSTGSVYTAGSCWWKAGKESCWVYYIGLPALLKKMAIVWNKKYKLASSENFDEVMKALGKDIIMFIYSV